MARCQNCSAPLLPNTNICQYCGIRNDIDLRGQHEYVVHDKSKRICPECGKPMQTISFKFDEAFLIERCEQCFGLFFDPGEIETLLAQSVKPAFEIDLNLLRSVNQERYQRNPIKYVKCPVCRVLMNRINFAHRSGVVVDQCKKHGVWLESGEVIHLMEWKKAGGQLLHKKHQRDSETGIDRSVLVRDKNILTTTENQSDLFHSIASVVFKLFE